MTTYDMTAMSNHSMDSDVFLSPKLNIRRFSFSRQQQQQAFCLAAASKKQQRQQPASVPEIRQQAFYLAVSKNQQRRQPASVPSFHRYSFNYYWKTKRNNNKKHRQPATSSKLLHVFFFNADQAIKEPRESHIGFILQKFKQQD